MERRTWVIGVIALGVGTATIVSLQGPSSTAATSGDEQVLLPRRVRESQPIAEPEPAPEQVTSIQAASSPSAGGPSPAPRVVAEQRLDALQRVAALPSAAPPNEPSTASLQGPAGAAGSGAQPGPAMPSTTYQSNADGIGHAITDAMPAIRDCYDKYWGHGQEPPNNVRVHLVVAPDPRNATRGTVAVAETVAGALQNGAVEDCLKTRLSTLNFERLNAPVDANLPLEFAGAQTTKAAE